jgi:hypothetical protein
LVNRLPFYSPAGCCLLCEPFAFFLSYRFCRSWPVSVFVFSIWFSLVFCILLIEWR